MDGFQDHNSKMSEEPAVCFSDPESLERARKVLDEEILRGENLIRQFLELRDAIKQKLSEDNNRRTEMQ